MTRRVDEVTASADKRTDGLYSITIKFIGISEQQVGRIQSGLAAVGLRRAADAIYAAWREAQR